MPPSESELGSAELEVLKTLWDHAPATVREVMNLLHDRGRKLAYTTVLTFLTRLEQKGFVRSDKSGVAYVYRPAVSREKITRSRLRALVEDLYDGAAAPLMVQLMQHERFTSEEIDEFHRLIERLDSKPRPRGRTRSKPKRSGSQ